MSKSELDGRMALNAMTASQLTSSMETMARNGTCGARELAAFVRLGGKIRMSYRTSDNVPVHDTTVETCPAS
jgi:hypothetical protein